jgi:hypothetical protein
VKVVRVDYDDQGQVNLIVEGAMEEWKSMVTAEPATPLPQYAEKVGMMRNLINGYALVSIPMGAEGSASTDENINPF